MRRDGPEFRPDDLLDRIEHRRVRRQVVSPAVKEVRVPGLRGIRAGAELLAEALYESRKRAVSSFDKTAMGKTIPPR